jgi:hypothetical protein
MPLGKGRAMAGDEGQAEDSSIQKLRGPRMALYTNINRRYLRRLGGSASRPRRLTSYYDRTLRGRKLSAEVLRNVTKSVQLSRLTFHCSFRTRSRHDQIPKHHAKRSIDQLLYTRTLRRTTPLSFRFAMSTTCT